MHGFLAVAAWLWTRCHKRMRQTHLKQSGLAVCPSSDVALSQRLPDHSVVGCCACRRYIYGVVACHLFEHYSHGEGGEVLFPEKFSSLDHAFAALFQLLTLDQWHVSCNDAAVVRSGLSSLAAQWILTVADTGGVHGPQSRGGPSLLRGHDLRRLLGLARSVRLPQHLRRYHRPR